LWGRQALLFGASLPIFENLFDGSGRLSYSIARGETKMERAEEEFGQTAELRKHPRVRVPAPFACSFARVGLERWLSSERTGLGVVLDVSLKGAKVMSVAAMNSGDHLAMSLRLPDQPTVISVDATVRWGREQTFGIEFTMVSQVNESRLRKFLSRA
jgi:hypothetical protein